MARQHINIGTSPNDGTGDPLRVGGDKINDNFGEVYSLLNNRVKFLIISQIDWSQNPNDEIRDYINNNGISIAKDEILFIRALKFINTPSQFYIASESHFYIWTEGAGIYGTPSGNPIGQDRTYWFKISVTGSDTANRYNLGEIGTTPIEEAVNTSGPYDVAPGQTTNFITERNGDTVVYLYVGTVSGEIGLGENQTTANDYVNLNEQTPDPVDPNDYITHSDFGASLYDTAETGFSTDLSNFTSLTEKFYVLMIDDGTNPVTYYFASKETNTEDFDGSRIYISASGTKHDLGAPTVTQNGYHFWDIGVLPVTINPSTEDWAFQAWFGIDGTTQLSSDGSLYVDNATGLIRSNVSRFKQTFTKNFGDPQTSVLAFEPTFVVNVFCRGIRLLEDVEWQLNLPMTIDVLIPFDDNDFLTVEYEHFITQP